MSLRGEGMYGMYASSQVIALPFDITLSFSQACTASFGAHTAVFVLRIRRVFPLLFYAAR